MSRLIDLAHPIHDGMVTYPGLPVPRTSTFLSRADSDGRYEPGTTFDIGMIELCTNTGTYLDTPFHRFADGHDLSGLALERCADLPAVVIHRNPQAPPAIGADSIGDLDVEGCAVLFDTGWCAHWGSDRYLASDHPFLDESCVDALIAGGAALVGIDSLNIDSTAGNRRPAHTKLLAAEIPIVEHLADMSALPVQGARFSAVPPRIAGLGTFTVRAFALVPDRADDRADDRRARPAVCEVVFDCHDPSRLAAFWAEAIGGTARVRSDDWATARDPRPGGLLLGFQRVPEPKSVKNRVHIDLWSDDIAADAARLEALGAARQATIVTDEVGSFQVLLDPEGNEFCLVT